MVLANDKLGSCFYRYIVLSCYQHQSPRPRATPKETVMMTNTNQDAHDDISYAELIAMIRDAARDGKLSAEDLRELRDYAVQLLRESDGTPGAVSA